MNQDNELCDVCGLHAKGYDCEAEPPLAPAQCSDAPTLSELGKALDVRIAETARLQFGEPVEGNGECDNCFAKGLEVWASLNIDGDWISLCARCVHEANAP